MPQQTAITRKLHRGFWIWHVCRKPCPINPELPSLTLRRKSTSFSGGRRNVGGDNSLARAARSAAQAWRSSSLQHNPPENDHHRRNGILLLTLLCAVSQDWEYRTCMEERHSESRVQVLVRAAIERKNGHKAYCCPPVALIDSKEP